MCYLLVVVPRCQHSLGKQLLNIQGQKWQVPEDTDAHTVFLQVLPTPNKKSEDYRKQISLYCTSARSALFNQMKTGSSRHSSELEKGKMTKCFSGVESCLRFDHPKLFMKGN